MVETSPTTSSVDDVALQWLCLRSACGRGRHDGGSGHDATDKGLRHVTLLNKGPRRAPAAAATGGRPTTRRGWLLSLARRAALDRAARLTRSCEARAGWAGHSLKTPRLTQLESERRATRRRPASGARRTIRRTATPLVRQARIRPGTQLRAGHGRRRIVNAGAGEAGGKSEHRARADGRRRDPTLAGMPLRRAVGFHRGRRALGHPVRMRRGRCAANGARQRAEHQGDGAHAQDDCTRNRTPPLRPPADVITPPHAPPLPNPEFNHK